MKENKPILKLTKEVVSYNFMVFLFLINFCFLLLEIDYVHISTREFNTWLAIIFILTMASFVFGIPIFSKKYVYDDSILNSISRKIPITIIVCNITAIILLALSLLSLLAILPTSFSTIYMYIAVSLFLLSLTVQIYYYSKMKIAYFFIMLAGAFLIEFFLISHYTIYAVNGAMGILLLIITLLTASNIVIGRNA